MENNIHRIFEEQIDKEIYQAYRNVPDVQTSTEWLSLKVKLNQHNKINQLKKLLLGLVILICLIGTGYYFNNISKPVSHNNSITKTNVEIKPISNTSNSYQTPAAATTINNLNNKRKNNIPKVENNLINTVEKNNDIEKLSTKNVILSNHKKRSAITNEEKNVGRTLSKKNKRNTETKIKILENETDFTLNTPAAINTNEKMQANEEENKIEIAQQPNDAMSNNTFAVDISKNAIIAPKVTKNKKEKRVREKVTLNIENDRTISIEAFSGINNSMKMQNNFAAFLAPNGYNNLRLHQEQQLQSITAGINISYMINNISITSGLNFLQIGDNVNYQPLQGNTIVTNANGRTQFTYTEIPLLIGKEWIKNRLGFGIKGGISTGILTQLSGQYASHNNFTTSTYDVKENKAAYRSVLFNTSIAPFVNYYLNENSNLFFAPTYQRNLQSITKVDADVKQRYNIIGFRIGIKSRIN